MERQANNGDLFINLKVGNSMELKQNNPVRDNGLNDKMKKVEMEGQVVVEKKHQGYTVQRFK